MADPTAAPPADAKPATPEPSPTPAAAASPSTPATPSSAAPDAASAAPGGERAAKAFAQLRTIGTVMALVGALLLAYYAMVILNAPAEPREADRAFDGGDLHVELTGEGAVNATVKVTAFDSGKRLGLATTDADGKASFEGLEVAGVLVEVTAGNATLARQAWVPDGRELDLRLATTDPAQQDGWTGWNPAPGAAVAIQAVILVVIIAGGSALALRKGYLVGLLGAGVLVGTGLQLVLVPVSQYRLLGIAMAALGVYAIVVARRAKPLFGRKPGAA